MSSINQDKKYMIKSKKEKPSQKRNKKNSPYIRDKADEDLDDEDYIANTNQFYEVSEEQEKKYIPQSGKRAQYTSKYNNINTYGLSDNNYVYPIGNRDISVLTDSTLFDNSTTNTNLNNTVNNMKVKGLNNNISLHEVKTTKSDKNKMKAMNLNTNINNSYITNNNNSTILNNNLTYNSEPYNSKYSFKINKIKDDYIDFLQKEFEDHTKNNAKLPGKTGPVAAELLC